MSKTIKIYVSDKSKTKIRAKNRSVRPDSFQEVSEDLDILVRKWNKSEDKKKFQKRFKK